MTLLPRRHPDAEYVQRLVEAWEAVHKKGQLTLWILLALKDGPKPMVDIKDFIERATNWTLTVDDQSMYRALRRYHETEMTDYEAVPGKGPDKKVHRLSPLGAEVLSRFVQRNIVDTLYRPAVKALIERSRE